jgi:peptide chain release factor 1
MPDFHESMQKTVARYDELNMLLADPDIMSDQTRYRKLMQEHSSLSPLVELFERWKDCTQQLQENRELLSLADDEAFRELVHEEIATLADEKDKLEYELNDALRPRDPNDQRNVIIEIRGGAGGDEAALFAAVLFRMYSSYAESRGWRIEIIDMNQTELGGLKELVFMVEGQGAYSRFKYESGVHRVQRVPVTESGGRIHTSTVTVAVLPEADDVEIEVDPNDLEIDTFRASGAGGQHVNRTDSAIRITHRPSGLVVTCQDQRSQHKNKEQAMRVLKSRLLEIAQNEQSSTIASDRKSQVGTGDRSERIRTYNYHQGRVTDHRIGLTLYRLEEILEGDMDEIVQGLITAEHNENIGRENQVDEG